MNLYIYTPRPDLAATSAADLLALANACADPSTAANAAIIAKVTGKIEPLTQGDSGEALALYFSDDGTTYTSWSTDPSTTLAVGLGDSSPRSAYTYAATTNTSISGNARLCTLALNTTALRDALEELQAVNPRANGGYKYLHVRKTTGGVTETVAMIPLLVQAGVLTDSPEELGEETYVSTTQARAGYVINVSGVTSLTGGGATALDGLDAGSATYPAGCIIVTTEEVTGGVDIMRHWKLKNTYVAADDVDNGVVKPDNSNATTNAVHWKQLG